LISRITDVVAIGSCSEPLRTSVFPVTSAQAENWLGFIAGKLNGVIATQTPSGSRTCRASMVPATLPAVEW
jgi:hypothetical protein